MPKIHQLEKQVAELIAAGEVVDRPASVIKELLENAIDAGAKNITVEIQRGGITYMRITDDGCGIAPEDVPTAFLRHATSKVLTAQDLNCIQTLGFRGEALASVAAMSRVEMLTRTPQSDEGTHYVICGGEEQECAPAGCPVGTTIVVRDLFYNIPARMKFLKKDVGEANAVAAVVDKVALSHPEISFRFLRDGQRKLLTPGDGKLLSAIYAVLGKEFAQSLYPVENTWEDIVVTGFITAPTAGKGSRGSQNFYLNGRYIQSRTCMAALEEAYKNSIMVGRFPGCVLNVQIPPQTVDVNVHPAKLEVRFTREKDIFHSVYYAVKGALDQKNPLSKGGEETGSHREKVNALNLYLSPEKPQQQRLSAEEYRRVIAEPSVKKGQEPLTLQSPAVYQTASTPSSHRSFSGSFQEKSKETKPASKPAFTPLPPQVPEVSLGRRATSRPGHSAPKEGGSQSQDTSQQPTEPLIKVLTPAHPNVFSVVEKSKEHASLSSQKESPLESPQNVQEASTQENPFAHCRYIGELFATYILLEGDQSLLLVDKHAAHERILFNRLKAAQQGAGEGQLLLTPLTVVLPKEQYAVAVEHLQDFSRLGFEVQDFGDGSLLVREIPMLLAKEDARVLVEEIAQKLFDNRRDITPDVLDHLLHSVACKSAIKAHDHSQQEELEKIIQLLREDPSVKYCPHGRPIVIEISQHELEKKFGRLG